MMLQEIHRGAPPTSLPAQPKHDLWTEVERLLDEREALGVLKGQGQAHTILCAMAEERDFKYFRRWDIRTLAELSRRLGQKISTQVSS